ncbi:ferrous iron transport protein B [Thermoanaerobacter wiegelii]|uniref:Ferrous iron transport protein B n=1 Tax=Thermoanaerobacter wiegelii Rt8.B1 TaxID=697303 RepID=G2MRZ6_9THEO|nr:ferrous iron transport protein B [Thermoanaerobacter wiegelii]AEM77742.1 ferrous iron transport protein B [Thermoanaerobacter wiegelii Rt8.B1]
MKNEIVIALAGNANVGKSVIFNQLTGLTQIIGNWPGKTVERAEGVLRFKGRTIKIVDLPGIYSLSAYSQEEIVSREFIAFEKPDVVINVVDASNLERNLFFTVQLLELHVPMVMALNQVDYAIKKGIDINVKRLEELLGIPVVKTIATKGKGLEELIDKVLEIVDSHKETTAKEYDIKQEKILKYRNEVSEYVMRIYNILLKYNVEIINLFHPLWISLKLIEEDSDIIEKLKGEHNGKKAYEEIQKELEDLKAKIDSPLVTLVTADRYDIASFIASQTVSEIHNRITWTDLIDNVALHKIFGYISMFAIVFISFYGIFKFGEYFSGVLENFFDGLKPLVYNLHMPNMYKDILWNGFAEGFISAITIVLPYILPFYVFLSILENTGYLARIAFLMDEVMHKVGLHGKALIPILMGFGCNVPAVLGTKILETDREIFIASFMSTLVPCSARIVIILGTIGVFMGPQYALSVFALDVLVVYIAAYFANKIAPGKPYDLIMELPGYRMPALKPTLKQIWFRIKDFLYVALPIIVAGSLVLEIFKYTGIFKYVTYLTDPIVVKWLGLPSIVGIVLIFGILRKELTLIMLLTLSGTSHITEILSPKQMIVFGVVTMLYIPCIATIAALKRTIGWKKTWWVVFVDIFVAILAGGILNQILTFI